MGKIVKVNMRSLFLGRLDVDRLRPNPSFAACLDPSQHLLKDRGWDFIGWYVTLIVGAVRETVFLEEPTRAARVLVIPLGVLVELLACKVCDPYFICGHANLVVWRFILHQRASSFVISFSSLLVAFVFVSISVLASIFWT